MQPKHDQAEFNLRAQLERRSHLHTSGRALGSVHHNNIQNTPNTQSGQDSKAERPTQSCGLQRRKRLETEQKLEHQSQERQ